jgi:hypothetical protein
MYILLLIDLSSIIFKIDIISSTEYIKVLIGRFKFIILINEYIKDTIRFIFSVASYGGKGVGMGTGTGLGTGTGKGTGKGTGTGYGIGAGCGIVPFGGLTFCWNCPMILPGGAVFIVISTTFVSLLYEYPIPNEVLDFQTKQVKCPVLGE